MFVLIAFPLLMLGTVGWVLWEYHEHHELKWKVVFNRDFTRAQNMELEETAAEAAQRGELRDPRERIGKGKSHCLSRIDCTPERESARGAYSSVGRATDF